MVPFKKHNTLILLLLCMAFIFVCARAVLVDMTHDEAYSFLNIKHFWYAQFLCNANSHWLNSFGMWLACDLGFEKTWHLRWLSLASASTLFIIGYYWIRTLEKPALKYLAFALAFLNPFTLDYLMMARGYASGIALETLSLFFFVTYLQNQKRNYSFASLLCSGLAAFANFNFFYFFIAFLVIYNFTLYFKKDLSFLKNKRFYIDGIISLGFILIVLRALLFIKRCSMDFGLGDENFIESIFSSYLDGLMYSNARHKEFFIYGLTLFIFVLATLLYGILKFKSHNNKIYFYSSIIFSIVLFLHVLNHYCFGVLYPYYRGALHLFPLLVITCVYFLYFIIPDSTFKTVFLYGLALALAINFLRGVNFHSTIDFYHQSDSKDAFEFVEELGAKKVGLSHEHQGVYINYYQETEDYKYRFDGKLLNTYDDDPNWVEVDRLEDFDHLILFPPYNLNYYKKRKIKFTILKIFPSSKTIVVKVEK